MTRQIHQKYKNKSNEHVYHCFLATNQEGGLALREGEPGLGFLGGGLAGRKVTGGGDENLLWGTVDGFLGGTLSCILGLDPDPNPGPDPDPDPDEADPGDEDLACMFGFEPDPNPPPPSLEGLFKRKAAALGTSSFKASIIGLVGADVGYFFSLENMLV